MKNKILCFWVIVYLLIIQNVFSGDNDTGGFSLGYSGSEHSIQEFYERIYEIMNDQETNEMIENGVLGWSRMLFGCYGVSVHSLQEFKRRLNEIINDGEFVYPIHYRYYAASQNNLEEFKRRYYEIMNDIDFLDISNSYIPGYGSVHETWNSFVYGNYASSQNSYQEFRIRLNEIMNDNEFNERIWRQGNIIPYYGNYAGSQNSLVEFKRRFNEIMNVYRDHFFY